MNKNLFKLSMLLVAAAVCFSCEKPELDTDETDKDKYPEIEGMVLVKGGTFQMKDTDDALGHIVTLSTFYIGKYELTQAEYTAVIGSNPSKYHGDSLPVENVSWYEAVEFCNALSVAEGLIPYYTIDKETKDSNNESLYDMSMWTVTCNTSSNGYRLPTEAEWEYAARGGNRSQGYTYSGSNTIDVVAWYDNNSNHITHNVGTKAANELGIYDMSGNVREWCWDWKGAYGSAAQTNPVGSESGEDRVFRGGACINKRGIEYCESAHRDGFFADFSASDIGFRLVRSKV